MKKVLLINGYETFEGIGQNTLNKSLVQIAKDILETKGHKVKITEIEQGFDAAEEVEKHLWADVVLIQTPIYWFGIPALFKSYIDRVHSLGYAQGKMCTGDGRTRQDASKKYGSGGALTDRKYMLSSTWNAPECAFNDAEQFFDGKNFDDVLVQVHKTYQFCGYKMLPSIGIFDVFKAAELSEDVENFRKHIETHF